MGKFYIGLDIGTNSVGIACTDENYNLLRAKGKDLWAVRLFDEAMPASDRRMKRAARRRLMRRRQRIALLQELFAPLMAKKDDTFFVRLNNSPYLIEDKRGTDSKYVIFADDDYNDADFYNNYKTIYHLRRALIRGEAKKDIRLYYIAIHHILKYRGNFLYEGQSLSDVRDVSRLFGDLNNQFDALGNESAVYFDESKLEEFKKIATEKRGINARNKECEELFGKMSAEMKSAIKLLLGGKVVLSKIFGREPAEGEKSVTFKSLDDIAFETLMQDFSDDEAEVLISLKKIYDNLTFESVLGGYEYISDALVDMYEKHKADLKKLKELLRDHKELRHAMFRYVVRSDGEKENKSEDKEGKKQPANYASYVGYTKTNGKKIACKRCVKVKDFYDFVKKMLTDHRGELDNDALADEILGDIENETFMPRILNADNGTFPYQVNEQELKKILENAEKDFPEFREVSEGCTLSEKILSLLRFRIPYYVGPLNTYHEDKGGNSWMVRRAAGRITPWNFDEKVDKKKSNEKFMRRMTNKCSYLHGCDVLPKCSILYQKFIVLDQLNKLQIDGEPVSVALKQRIFDELYMTRKSVSKNNIKDYLVKIGQISEKEKKDTDVKCGADDFKASMSTYFTLKNILGDLADKNEQLCEDIVLWHTLNTDKENVRELIEEKYGDIPEVMKNIRALKGLVFKDFGKLSREFLCELPGGVDENTGEVYTVLGELYKTNKNLNELLWSEEYSFRESIDKMNGTASPDVTYKDVEELYVSPAVRRGIWQALRMCDEYVEALGRKPDKVFVEVTRYEDKEKKGKKQKSRKEELEELYKQCDGTDDLKARLGAKNDVELRQDRLYLYFRQLGKCMYSGDNIELDALMSDQYDIDHIIPQSLAKDDSWDNRVLVKSELNRRKTNDYPVPDFCRSSRAVAHWEVLKEKGLISEKKYKRLTRRTPITNEELEAFAARQIVFTGQASKAVAELLRRKYETDGKKVVYYSKAGNVSDFRKDHDFIKCRDTNDLHHARDAYLNIVVGNVYDARFGSLFRDLKCGKPIISNNAEKKLFTYTIHGAWDKDKSMAVVEKTLAKPSMCVTRYSYTEKGAFYNETVYGKTDKGVNAPRKETAPLADTSKYGGYKSLNTAYFAVVESSDKKGRRIKTIEAVPTLVSYRIGNDVGKLLEYFISKGLKDPVIEVSKLKKYSLLKYDGTPILITGITGNRLSVYHAVQWFTDRETDKYIKAMLKCLDDINGKRLPGDRSEYTVNASRKSDGIKINSETDLALYDKMIEQLSRPVYAGLSGARNFLKNLNERRSVFADSAVSVQIKALTEMVKFLNGRKGTSDLTCIGLTANAGKLLIGQDVTDVSLEFVNSSPCGLHTVIRKL